MAAISRVRRRYVTTVPKLLRKKMSVKVGDSMLWLPLSDKEFLAVILSEQKYRALSELLGNIKLTREARMAAEQAYFERARSEGT